jgi:hypothetical protein
MKLLYKPLGLILSFVGARLAMSLFRRVWSVAGHEEDAPKAKDRDRTWREVLAAATLQGAVFGATKAVVDRAGATWWERVTGVWPGREASKHGS